MGRWVSTSEDVVMRRSGCGTTGCIAAHLVLAAGLRISTSCLVSSNEVQEKLNLRVVTNVALSVQVVAANILGFHNNQAAVETLFFHSKWSEPYRSKYSKLSEAELIEDDERREQAFRRRASIAIARFRKFLKSGK